MKIAQLITRRELRGAEVGAADLCRSLTQRGHEVSLLGLFSPLDRDDAEHLGRDLPHVADLTGRKTRGVRWSVLSALTKSLSSFRPDIIQANAFNALKYAAISKLVSRAKWPLVYRNVGQAGLWITRPGQRLWGRLLLRQVDRVISVSDASRQDFSKTYRIPENEIVVMDQGVVVPRKLTKQQWKQKLLDKIACPDNCHLLVHVGSFSQEKNHLGLLHAFARTRKDHPNTRLILIGDGPLRNRIENNVATLHLSPHVHFLGAHPQAADLAGGADIMLISSHIEGIPGVLLEACARALPVISTDVGGISSIIQNRHNGILVPAGDMVTLGMETVNLLGNPALREQLGQKAHELIRESNDMEKFVDHYESIYHALATGVQGTTPAATFAPTALQEPD